MWACGEYRHLLSPQYTERLHRESTQSVHTEYLHRAPQALLLSAGWSVCCQESHWLSPWGWLPLLVHYPLCWAASVRGVLQPRSWASVQGGGRGGPGWSRKVAAQVSRLWMCVSPRVSALPLARSHPGVSVCDRRPPPPPAADEAALANLSKGAREISQAWVTTPLLTSQGQVGSDTDAGLSEKLARGPLGAQSCCPAHDRHWSLVQSQEPE